MHAQMDDTRCERTGFCVRLAPDLFALNADGPAVVLEQLDPDVELLREAEDLCPTRAISIVADVPDRESLFREQTIETEAPLSPGNHEDPDHSPALTHTRRMDT